MNKTLPLTNFNHYPKQTCILARPEHYHQLLNITEPVIARGQGCCYGDASLNENGQVILTEHLNRLLEFDPNHGILTVEAGIKLQDILDLIVPYGWFLPVTPGTQYASLGGCVAADVHGKNHHVAGSLGQHILGLELILAHGKTIHCSPSQDPDIFWATIGGMGLTGIIGTVVLQLIPIPSSYMQVTHRIITNFEQMLDALTNSTAPYNIAWLDLLNTGKYFGSGIIMEAHHAALIELPEELRAAAFSKIKKTPITIPNHCPNWLLNKSLLKTFNKLYRWRNSKKTGPFITHYQSYFYPLDDIAHWNRLYGKRGFIQYQCVIPTLSAAKTIQKMLEYLKTTPYPIYLASLKQFGAAGLGMLSFPMPGFTLALDIPLLDHGLFIVLDKLDDMVAASGGRVYLAKDARLKPNLFRAMYPRYSEWLAVKEKIDPEWFFSSSLSRRLEL